MTIRIDRGAEVRPGVFAWRVAGLGLSGQSRQPLLDACRQIERTGAYTGETASIFREGHLEPDMTCDIAKAASLTVSEPDRGRIHFAEYRPFVRDAVPKGSTSPPMRHSGSEAPSTKC